MYYVNNGDPLWPQLKIRS